MNLLVSFSYLDEYLKGRKEEQHGRTNDTHLLYVLNASGCTSGLSSADEEEIPKLAEISQLMGGSIG